MDRHWLLLEEILCIHQASGIHTHLALMERGGGQIMFSLWKELRILLTLKKVFEQVREREEECKKRVDTLALHQISFLWNSDHLAMAPDQPPKESGIGRMDKKTLSM